MVAVGGSPCQHLTYPATVPRLSGALSVLGYNVLLPNSKDGWWNYKMYLPPLGPGDEDISTWEYRSSLLRERIGSIDADVVCIQEVSPLSFEDDFAFMADELGYDGCELFKKGRFRPATFWKKDRVELANPAQHKDRTLLTSFRLVDEDAKVANDDECWHVLNCHLQAGKQGGRRVRQVLEGVSTAYKAAKNKYKEKDPENLKLIVCGDFNGGKECGAVQLLEAGSIGPDFLEDGEQVASKEKAIPIPAMLDVAAAVDRQGGSPPATLVVPELISLMVDQGSAETAYANPQFSQAVLDSLHRIYNGFASVTGPDGSKQMGKEDAERWLTIINLRVGRGTEFRNAAKCMGWVDPTVDSGSESEAVAKDERPPIVIPDNGLLSFDDFVAVYLDELRQGKFWGIAWDLSALGEPLPVEGVFEARYDRMYCSSSLVAAAVLDTTSAIACPNKMEPSDHLPICASFVRKNGHS
ncbi:hypothetical protein ACHAXT_010160 [Thalassiosira profunda]